MGEVHMRKTELQHPTLFSYVLLRMYTSRLHHSISSWHSVQVMRHAIEPHLRPTSVWSISFSDCWEKGNVCFWSISTCLGWNNDNQLHPMTAPMHDCTNRHVSYALQYSSYRLANEGRSLIRQYIHTTWQIGSSEVKHVHVQTCIMRTR